MHYNLTEILEKARTAKQSLSKITDEPELVRILQDNITKFVEAIEERKKHADEFTITVIGLVKAGKSSLLNSLLFEGVSVLPMAESPKTAALTVLRNNEKDATFYADIEFMNNISDHEIHSWDKSMQDFYHQEQHRVEGKDENDLAQQIKPFVAAGEGYAEFIKVVNMYLPGLHDSDGNKIRVVDTPGLDDPNVIRSEKTEIFLPQTDAFVFLFESGRFTGASQEYLFNLNKISYSSKLLLIGTKFDLLLADGTVRGKLFEFDGKGEKPQDFLLKVIEDEKNKQKEDVVHQRIREMLTEPSDDGRRKYLSSLLERPIFFTSMKWNPQTWKSDSNGEKPKTEIEKYFNERKGKHRQGEYIHLQLTDEFLKDLSGIDNVKKEYESLKRSKLISYEKWVANHIRKFTEDNENRQSVFSESTGAIVDALSGSLKELDKGKQEIETHIEKEQSSLLRFSDDINKNIEDKFAEFYTKLDERIQELRECIRIAKYKLNKAMDEAIISDSIERTFKICFFWTKKVEIPRNKNVRELKTITVCGKLNDFYSYISNQINDAYRENHLRFRSTLQKKLLPQIFSVLHKENDLLSIEIPKMNNEISQGTTWEISMDMEKYTRPIREKFQVSAQDKDVPLMIDLFEKSKAEIFKDVCCEAKHHCEGIRERLQHWQENFIKNCSARLEEKKKTFIEQIQDKERNQKRIKDEIETVKQIETALRSLSKLK